MSNRWAALINLPPEKEERLGAILAATETQILSMDWEQSSPTPPPGSPALIVAPIEDYACNKHTRLAWLRATEDRSAMAVLAQDAPTPETLRLQLDHDLLNVLPEALWNDPVCLERIVRGLLFPNEMFDISCFVPKAAAIEQFEITTLAEKHEIAEEVATLAQINAGDQRHIRDVYLIINELINNAFFHSFRNPEGEEKYSPRRFSRLDEGDRVVLEVAVAEDAIALAVEDNRGTLSPREVLKYLSRQSSGEGLYDSHGRGFYLVSNLVDHLGICLVPGERTRVVSMRHAGDTPPVRTLNFFVAPRATSRPPPQHYSFGRSHISTSTNR